MRKGGFLTGILLNGRVKRGRGKKNEREERVRLYRREEIQGKRRFGIRFVKKKDTEVREKHASAGDTERVTKGGGGTRKSERNIEKEGERRKKGMRSGKREIGTKRKGRK